MKILKKLIENVLVIEPTIFEDNRGIFFESFSHKKMQELGIFEKFLQDNHSMSKQRGTIRGMHFQSAPMAQSKLVRVVSGEIENFVVDIRSESETFQKYDSVVLSNKNKLILYIPKGFANGFKTMTDNVEVLYKVDNYYSPENDYSFRYDDSDIGIDWKVDNPVLSERDFKAPLFSEIKKKAIF